MSVTGLKNEGRKLQNASSQIIRVTFGKEQDTQSSQALQQFAESLKGTSWKGDTPSNSNQRAKMFVFKPDTAESAHDGLIARGLNLKVTNFDKLKDIGFNSREIERIRQFQD
ncbi:hypothetical protein GOD62_32560 [Sinorhizobium medicae]|nr:hypothetical protein [Sinorhizobium medicae]MDX0797235.1 hypothetical protein [Sinorhizobium medicae]